MALTMHQCVIYPMQPFVIGFDASYIGFVPEKTLCYMDLMPPSMAAFLPLLAHRASNATNVLDEIFGPMSCKLIPFIVRIVSNDP